MDSEMRQWRINTFPLLLYRIQLIRNLNCSSLEAGAMMSELLWYGVYLRCVDILLRSLNSMD